MGNRMALARNPARAEKKPELEYVYQTKAKAMTKYWTVRDLGIDGEKIDGLWLKALEAPTNVVWLPMGQVICHSWLQKQVGVRYPSLDHTASLSQYTPFGHQCITVTISFCFCFNLQRETLISSPHRRDGDLPFVISQANRTNGFPRSLTFIDIFFDLHLCPLFFDHYRCLLLVLASGAHSVLWFRTWTPLCHSVVDRSRLIVVV